MKLISSFCRIQNNGFVGKACLPNNSRVERKIQGWVWEKSDGRIEASGRLKEPVVSYLKIMGTKESAFEKGRPALISL